MRTARTSSLKKRRLHLMHRRHPTTRTTRGGLWSTSSTVSRRVPPSSGHGSGSTNPCTLGLGRWGRAASATALTVAVSPLSPWQWCCSRCAGSAGPRSRHATSRAARLGLPLPVAKQLLGHTKIENTARYTHFDDTHLFEIADFISDLIDAAMEGRAPHNPSLKHPIKSDIS
ncbi:hypothetical protein ACFQFS_14110 [Novosphingobium lubricantis]|jgi:hypothetical protein